MLRNLTDHNPGLFFSPDPASGGGSGAGGSFDWSPEQLAEIERLVKAGHTLGEEQALKAAEAEKAAKAAEAQKAKIEKEKALRQFQRTVRGWF